jgi:hypothetical protein
VIPDVLHAVSRRAYRPESGSGDDRFARAFRRSMPARKQTPAEVKEEQKAILEAVAVAQT